LAFFSKPAEVRGYLDVDDPVNNCRSAMIDPVIAVADAIIENAATELADPHGTATALVTVNVHRLLTLTPDTSDADLQALVQIPATIWERALYPAKGYP
jgi:hypothetical protein